MEDVQTTHMEVLEPETDRRGDAVAGVIAEKLGKVLRTQPQFSAISIILCAIRTTSSFDEFVRTMAVTFCDGIGTMCVR